MTYKYASVRRAIYEENPLGKINKYRDLSAMIKLFKLPYWIILIAYLISFLVFIVCALFYPNSKLIWVSIMLVIIAAVFSEIPREKYLYNDSIRSIELSEKRQNYNQYIWSIRDVLIKYDINTLEKALKLREECETILKIREDKFTKINSKIVDMLIGVPLGALITSIIYAKESAATTIGALIIIGLCILGTIKIINILNYYSEGYFKDRQLLEALNEISYYEEIFTQNKQMI